MRGKLNKLAAGALVTMMALTPFASVTAPYSTLVPVVHAAEVECAHENTGRSYTKEPTCTKSGIYDLICFDCDTVLSTGNVEEATGHIFSLGTFENGKLKTQTCEMCGLTEDFSPEADSSECDHDDEFQATYNYAVESCKADGYSGDLVCEKCGTLLSTGEKIPALGEHEWNEVNYVEPTCTEDGKVTYECAICGKTKEEVVKTVGHQFGYNVLHKPTCTEEGEKAGRCRICGLEDWQIIPALGHKWDDGKVTKEATTTSEGTRTYTCKTCGETKEETIAKLPADTKPDTKPSDDTTTAKPDTKPSDDTTTAKPDTKPSDDTTTAKPDTKPSDGTTAAKTNTKPSNGTTTAKPSTKPSKGTTTKKPSTSTTNKKQNTKSAKTVVKAGTKLTVAGNTYVVTKAGSEVCFSKSKARVKSLNIPGTVKVKKTTYKVTSISANAVKNNKKIKTVTIGANIRSIASKAFKNCPNLKKVVIKSTKLTKKTAGKKSFNKVNKRMVIKVPAKVKKSYKKIFKGLIVK